MGKVHMIGPYRDWKFTEDFTLCGQDVHYYWGKISKVIKRKRKQPLPFTIDPSKVTCKSCDNIRRYK